MIRDIELSHGIGKWRTESGGQIATALIPFLKSLD